MEPVANQSRSLPMSDREKREALRDILNCHKLQVWAMRLYEESERLESENSRLGKERSWLRTQLTSAVCRVGPI